MRRDCRARAADVPRPQAPRHPQYRRQSDRGARAPRAGDPYRPRRWRPGDARRRQGRRARRHQGRRGHRPDQPRSGDLADDGIDGSPADQVARLAELAREAGLDGIVCSGAEVAAARAALAGRLLRGSGRSPGRAPTPPTRSASSRRARRSTTARRCWSSAARSPAPPTRRARSRDIAATYPMPAEARILR